MTLRSITSAVVAVLALVVASCGTSRNYPDRREYPPTYPYPDGRYPDGRYPDGRYPDGRYPDGRYPDGRYPDRRSYPTSRYPAPLPPGHAKKVYGHKSAKAHAPGQRKKYDDRYYDPKSKTYRKKSKGKH